MEFGVRDARENLSKLIKQVLDGEQIIITNHGEPLVQIVPVRRKPKVVNRGFGSLPNLTASLPAGWDSEEASDQVAKQFDIIKEMTASKLRDIGDK